MSPLFSEHLFKITNIGEEFVFVFLHALQPYPEGQRTTSTGHSLHISGTNFSYVMF